MMIASIIAEGTHATASSAAADTPNVVTIVVVCAGVIRTAPYDIADPIPKRSLCLPEMPKTKKKIKMMPHT